MNAPTVSPLSDVSYELESAAFPGALLTVSDMRIVEALDEPYKLELLVSTPETDHEQHDMARLLGRDCTLRLDRRGRTRTFRGIVREVHDGDDEPHRAWARIVVVPALWMLGLGRDSRIFQDMTVPEILAAVLVPELARYGRLLLFVPTRPYARREYCVQYQESNLDFAHRLMEEEGIGYTFDHTLDRESLVLHDSNRLFVPIDGLFASGFVPYEPHNLEVSTTEPVVHFQHRRRPTIDDVVIRDFDWTQQAPIIETQARRDLVDLTPNRAYEHGLGRSLYLHHYAEQKYQAHDGAAQAPLRLEAYGVDELVGIGRGRVTGFAPGRRFTLSGHPTIGFDGEYVITHVEHTVVREDGSEADPYSNRFECIPYARPHRPARRTRKPRVQSVQTAMVVGPVGEEIHTDEHGRIKVCFHWDRVSARDETASCWLRVQQSWAGPGWGFLFLPRIGMEVIVTFLDGDPDRPLVTGCVYNGASRPPYPLPIEKTKSTIKTRSSPGGNGFNELRFEDRADAEEIFLHGQRDWNTIVLHDVTERVGHDRDRRVEHDESVHIGNHLVQTVGATRTRSVGESETVTIGGPRPTRVGADESRQVDGDDELSVEGSRRVGVRGAETRRVQGDGRESIGGHWVQRTGGQSWAKATRVVIEADEEIVLRVGEAYVRITADSIHVEAFETFINSGEPSPDTTPPVPPEELG